jgi:hypothetical protein
MTSSVPPTALGERFHFQDGTLNRVGLFSEEGWLGLDCDAPLLPGHPSYSKNRMRQNYRRGRIYSPADWRSLRLRLEGVRDMRQSFSGAALEDGRWHDMPYELTIEEWSIESAGDEFELRLEGEEIMSLRCVFREALFEERPLQTSIEVLAEGLR